MVSTHLKKILVKLDHLSRCNRGNSKNHGKTTTKLNMDVSLYGGTPKSSFSIGFSIINHPFWGIPILGNTHMSWRGCYIVPHFKKRGYNPLKGLIIYLYRGEITQLLNTMDIQVWMLAINSFYPFLVPLHFFGVPSPGALIFSFSARSQHMLRAIGTCKVTNKNAKIKVPQVPLKITR